MPAPRSHHRLGAIAAHSRAKRRPVKNDDREPSTKEPVKATLGNCWCGEPYPHDWEGKSDGKPHPR